MRAWIFDITPDFRVQVKLDGSSSRALFTYRGRAFSVIARNADHREAVIVDSYLTLRDECGYPVEPPRTRELEAQIVQARFRGDDAAADALERELVTLNAGGAGKRRVRNHGQAQTTPERAPFGRREAW